VKKSGAAALVLVTVLLVALVGVRFVSGRTAENGCTDEAERRGSSTVSTDGWSWSPLGTTCTFGSGGSETHVFW
jgi:hypothetical protein